MLGRLADAGSLSKQRVLVVALLGLGVLDSISAQTCKATYSLSGSWQTNGNTFTSLNIDITNTGSQVIAVPWTLTLDNPAYAAVSQVGSHPAMAVTDPGVYSVASCFVPRQPQRTLHQLTERDAYLLSQELWLAPRACWTIGLSGVWLKACLHLVC